MTAAYLPWATLASSLASDLLTDWIPDVIGAADVLDSIRRAQLPAKQSMQVPSIQVAMSKRFETIPVIGVSGRARLHCITHEALSHYTPDMNVFGYRSLSTDYRGAYRERIIRIRDLARDPRYPLVLAADVRRFSASVSLPVILRQPWMTSRLADELTSLKNDSGRCLLPGHHWANRIGSAILSEVDTALTLALGRRWVRWADDIHIFVTDSNEAEQVRSILVTALTKIQLELSQEKTHLLTRSELLYGPARDVSGDPVNVWRHGVAAADERALRYALPRLAARHDPAALKDLLSITAEHPSLFPRAVSYLDHFIDDPTGLSIAVKLFNRETMPAVIARLLALGIRHPALAATAPERAIEIAQTAGVLALEELAWRIHSVRGKTSRPPTQRLAEWAKSRNQLELSLPIVETLL